MTDLNIERCGIDIVDELRSFEADHAPDGWPAVKMSQISALCAYAEHLRAENDTLRSMAEMARFRIGFLRDFMTAGERRMFIDTHPGAAEWFEAITSQDQG